jgi:hypothetical protein
MSAEKNRCFQIRADDRFFEMLDLIRKNENDLPNRSEMIRRLVEEKNNAITIKKSK